MSAFHEQLQRLVKQSRREVLFPRSQAAPVSLDRSFIESILRHRGPMLLLDRITGVALSTGGVLAERTLAIDDLGFAGHFPGEPIYPGCLQVEMMGQLGLTLRWFLSHKTSELSLDARPPSVRLIRLYEAFFVSEARPGERLTVMARCIEDNGYTITCIGQLLRGDVILSGCAFEAMYAEENV